MMQIYEKITRNKRTTPYFPHFAIYISLYARNHTPRFTLRFQSLGYQHGKAKAKKKRVCYQRIYE